MKNEGKNPCYSLSMLFIINSAKIINFSFLDVRGDRLRWQGTMSSMLNEFAPLVGVKVAKVSLQLFVNSNDFEDSNCILDKK